jgi:hypothetical protein
MCGIFGIISIKKENIYKIIITGTANKLYGK